MEDEKVLAGLLALGLLSGRPKEVKLPEEKPPEKPPEEVVVHIVNNLEESVKVNINGKDYMIEPKDSVEIEGKAPFTVVVKLYYPWSEYAFIKTEGFEGYRWYAEITYHQGGSYTISIEYVPELKPKVEYVTLTVKAVADSTELNVDVEGYEGGSWRTPFETEVEKGKVISFLVPTEVEVGARTYRLDSVEGGVMSVVGAGKARIDVLADTDKAVIIKYAEKKPKEPKWVCDFGSQGKIKVYDAWYDRSKKELGVDIEVVCGTTGSEVDLVGADIIAAETPNHGTLINSEGCGRRTLTNTIEEREFNYGILIAAKWWYGGATIELVILNNEIRRI